MFAFLRRQPGIPPTLQGARPRVLWIELTSKCPFDCVFCSRRFRRGGGTHMDMALYRRIIAGLKKPEIIRLNYSGESTHHPYIIEAIQLAAATGARTELVTALASLPERLVQPLATSGLDQLTVSLHTLNPLQYREIFGYGSIESVKSRLALLAAARARNGGIGPTLDIAVVAMRRNLSQLLPLAAFAVEWGATGMAIHPVIRRDPIAETFPDELEDDRLRPAFLADLEHKIAEIRSLHPDLALTVSTPEIDGAGRLTDRPTPFPAPLPDGARIHSCDQNPWETIHILADGSVVTCEVRDHLSLGQLSLNGPDLPEYWHGRAYSDFRLAYRAGNVRECKSCPYKIAYIPSPRTTMIDAALGMHAQLSHGWHTWDGSGLLWGKQTAALELARMKKDRYLHIEGFVPPTISRVQVLIDEIAVGEIRQTPSEAGWIAVDLPLPPARGATISITLTAERVVPEPDRTRIGVDTRELGFGLKTIGTH
jgi:MoaA/NifB/PqqE/SkfB family radical SAM enzyme